MDELEAGKLTECCELLNTIANQDDNKKCFDCTDKDSPRYLCSTFLTFVCSCCASIHQEFGHKIKVLSVFGFTVNEIYVLKGTGNKVAADKWLARWDPTLFNEPDPTSPMYKEEARKYIKAKYIEKKWVKLPPPLPMGKTLANPCRSEGPTPRDTGSLDDSPRGHIDVSPRSHSDISPRGNNDISPRGHADASPRGYVEISPRKYVEVRKYTSELPGVVETPPRSNSLDRDTLLVHKQQQHDSEKPPFNPFLRDPFSTPPVVYSYMPQHMILPMSFPPGQYGYSVALDAHPFPQYYSCPTPFQQPLYTIPFDPHPQVTSVSSDSVSSWADIKPRERGLQHSCKELPRVPVDDDVPQHVPVLRSASDNSLATTMRPIVEAAVANDCKCSTGTTAPSTPGSTQNTSKQKIQGLVNKVTGLLKKSKTDIS
jgi:hypothetical protein